MYTHILVPLDGSAGAERILPWLRPMARESRGIVRLLMVLPPPDPVAGEGRAIEQVEHRYLQQVALPLLADGIPVALEVRFGDPVDAILATAREMEADLIAVAPAPHRGLRDLLGGSLADRLLRRSPVPVLLARPSGQRAA